MALRLLLIACVLSVTAAALNAEDAPPPERPPEDPGLTKQLDAIDAKAGKIKDFTADFRQEKFTALLKKPLVSKGRVRVGGASIRWDTREPEPAVLFSDGKDVRMYYPGQRLLEIYPIDQRLGDLAASPLPKLKTLREHFSIGRAEPETFPKADASKSVALRMIPLDEAIREHVDEIRVLLDSEAAHILELEILDADGDRTRITFEDVRLDTGIKSADLALTVPKGTTVSRPLEAGNGTAPPPADRAGK
jgi:outer membrane lipoprotein-sorting protein